MTQPTSEPTLQFNPGGLTAGQIRIEPEQVLTPDVEERIRVIVREELAALGPTSGPPSVPR